MRRLHRLNAEAPIKNTAAVSSGTFATTEMFRAFAYGWTMRWMPLAMAGMKP